jgi:hypothetical protein
MPRSEKLSDGPLNLLRRLEILSVVVIFAKALGDSRPGDYYPNR